MSKNDSPISTRPPIVAVMGHIDHGKTTLLDYIRSANVAKKETGGITQHISAYQTEVKLKNGKSSVITFLDTPGHAAFCSMRSRGAKITDIVVLVVSGVDGIMAQTKECIREVKNTGIPVIVAMTKMDLAEANPEKIKGQLVEAELTPEEYGGQVALIPVSVKTGLGIDKLLEMILLNAEILELKDDHLLPSEAVVIESRIDKSRGPVALAIVKKGTLKIGDQIFTDNTQCKIKAMFSPEGTNLRQAYPGTPVEILGFETPPSVGSLITAEKPEPKSEHVPIISSTPESDTPKLKIVLKSDVQGTLEALKGSFSDDVVIISSGVGPVSDNDIFVAAPVHATIYAFNVNTPKFIKNLAGNEKVPIFESKVIYDIIEDIQTRVLKLLDPTIEETVLGEGKIIAEFNINKVRISGVHVNKGEITKSDAVHLVREGKIIKDTRVEGIHQAKNIIDKAKMGLECGMTFKPYVDFKLNDVIISYKIEK